MLGTAVDATAGTCRTQVLQIGPSALTVRGTILPGHDPTAVWHELSTRLRDVLDSQGLANVRLEITPDEPEHLGAGGKFRRVVPLPQQ